MQSFHFHPHILCQDVDGNDGRTIKGKGGISVPHLGASLQEREEVLDQASRIRAIQIHTHVFAPLLTINDSK